MSNFKTYIGALISAIIAGASGYFFSISKGGVHFENVSLLIICIIAIITTVIFLSKAKGKSFEPLADALGLKVSGSFDLGGGGHVDMEGEMQGRAIFLRYEEAYAGGRGTMLRSSTYENKTTYNFTLQLNNPSKIDLYTCQEGILNTPANILSLPKKLDTNNWEWAEFLTVYGVPTEAVNSIFSNKDNFEILSAFLSKFDLRVKNDKMEFKILETKLDDAIPELKEILNYALSVANAIDNG